MLPPRLDATGVKPAGAVTPPAAAIPVSDARQAALTRALGPLVGQSMQGQVLSNYHDGSSLVRVAGASVRMMLPPGAQVGAELPMTLLSVTPRPTFQVGNNAPQTAVPLYSDAGLPQGEPGDAAPLPSQSAPMAGRQPGAGQGATGTPGTALPAGAETPDETSGAARSQGAPSAAAAQQQTPAGTAHGADAAHAQALAYAQAAAAKAAQAVAQSRPAAPPAGPQTAAGQEAAQPGNAAPAQQARPQSLGAMLLSKAPLTPADQLPDLGRDTPAPTLSQGARSIASALANAYHAPGTPATIAGKTPLVQDGAPDPKPLAKSLQDALGSSGLFYESHVAEWAEGKRPMADLQREPQMQRAEQQSGRQSAESLARAAQVAPDLSAAQMINQQLHAHEQQRVQWHGEAWPGQPMQWDVERQERDARDQRQGQHEREPETLWRSGVRFSLPMLGKVAASVTLVGDQVHIQLQAGSDGSADTMRAWAGELQRALDAAGSPLASLSIGTEGAADGEAA